LEGGILTQFIAAGLTLGLIYGITGIGFSIVYNATGAINFAQGEFVVLGAFAAITLNALGFSIWLSVFLAAVFVSLGAFLVYLLLLKRVAFQPLLMVVATIGLSLSLKTIALYFWGREPLGLKHFVHEKSITFFGASITYQHLLIFALALFVYTFLTLFFRYTLTGKAMKAVVEEVEIARTTGINPIFYQSVAFAIAGAFAALSGSFMAPISMLSYYSGGLLGLKGFASAVVGGLDKPQNAVFGGVIIGLIEALSVIFIPSGLKDLSALVFLLIILAFKPEGLFVKAEKRWA
jgi:branched-chain amino acid transport system permease protein